MKKFLDERGMSLLEVTMGAAMMAGLAFAAFHFQKFSDKETNRLNEDIQNTISRYGGAIVLMRDLNGAEPSFNFLNIQDDNDLPFFVLASNELCKGSKCERRKSLQIPQGKLQSESIYLLVRKGYINEMLKFSVDPITTYEAKSYSGINWQAADPDLTISKKVRPYSPWEPGRLLLLSSELQFLDCKNTVNKNDGSCTISCADSGTCNYVAKRPMQFLGIVNANEKDLMSARHAKLSDLFKKSYVICRPNADLKCESHIDMSSGIDSPKTFFEKLPYIPGLNNRTYLSPVELVEYYLKKPELNSKDHEIKLFRSRYVVEGSTLVQEPARPIISGVTSVLFKRANISNSLIEYKLKKARLRKPVK